MNKKIIPQSRPKGKILSPETREFLADYHNFTNKWPTLRIAKLPEINVVRQTIYALAKKNKEENE